MRDEFRIRFLPHGGYIVSGLESYDPTAYVSEQQWTMLAAFNDLPSALAYLSEHMIKADAPKPEAS